ncbi:hypothetical protein [Motiliproteus sp. SC1-56]|uniref:hypothetical protein n=1 Tax=Motiliproteus sp. SC1-56 TaxID=2799565 RepID=UPI001A8D5B80|nr:hypothetical protein [Motiliproteus sp. SC1-56]
MVHAHLNRHDAISRIEARWAQTPSWRAQQRPYQAEDVVRLVPPSRPDLERARAGARRFCQLMETSTPSTPVPVALVRSAGQVLSCLQEKRATISLVDDHEALAPSANGVQEAPLLTRIKRISGALHRAAHREGGAATIAEQPPLVADTGVRLDSSLDIYQAVLELIAAGAAGVILDSSSLQPDASLKPLNPELMIKRLIAAHLAADVLDAGTLILARTGSLGPAPSDDAIEQRFRPICQWGKQADVLILELDCHDLDCTARWVTAFKRQFPGKRFAYGGPIPPMPAFCRQLETMGFALLMPPHPLAATSLKQATAGQPSRASGDPDLPVR